VTSIVLSVLFTLILRFITPPLANREFTTRREGTVRSHMHDYTIFIIVAVCVVIGAGLFRIGLHLKSDSRTEDVRRARQFITLGIAFGFAAILILVFEGNEVVSCNLATLAAICRAPELSKGLAVDGKNVARSECPLLGVKRTSQFQGSMSAFDLACVKTRLVI
jgi:hypothetical protein